MKETLADNISSLFKTAAGEIARKDAQNKELSALQEAGSGHEVYAMLLKDALLLQAELPKLQWEHLPGASEIMEAARTQGA